MSTSAALDRLKGFLSTSPFVALCGLSLVEADAEVGRVVFEMPPAESLERVRGSGHFHGGAILALIDTAACFAMTLQLEKPPPTANCRVDFLRSAGRQTVRAIATVRRAGRVLGIADVEVLDETGELVALGRATFALGK